jgi:hypothetical protein
MYLIRAIACALMTNPFTVSPLIAAVYTIRAPHSTQLNGSTFKNAFAIAKYSFGAGPGVDIFSASYTR